jgi:hypothetical protein
MSDIPTLHFGEPVWMEEHLINISAASKNWGDLLSSQIPVNIFLVFNESNPTA